MLGKRRDRLLKGVSGLEGGVVASGSTCGVVTGGALGIALMHEAAIDDQGEAGKPRVLARVGDYAAWFAATYGSVLCRNRTKTNFYSTASQLRYFLPGDRVVRCLWHIRGALRHLADLRGHPLDEYCGRPPDRVGHSIHCAPTVLRAVANRTGIGDPELERLSFVFDGGVGLQGGICGAVAGAVLAVNLLVGLDIRHLSYHDTVKRFAIGHVNLLVDNPIGKPELFGIGKTIVDRFKQAAGSMECQTITGRPFSDWQTFQDHIHGAATCHHLMDVATDLAVAAINGQIADSRAAQTTR